ncbi:MAG: aminopeptidase P family protein [Paraclostridium sp.]|uniref:aminopeptidase P family protein n=1 Tax=Paraclostridium sp. TaxID=2023273 RepID=UPI003F2F4D8D
MINKRLDKLRSLMKEKDIFAYMIPSSDYHQSEYVGDFFKLREYMSGFTGSAGTLIVTMEECGLWTDGRYFIQAEKELENSQIKLFKMFENGVLTIPQYLEKKMPKGSKLGFDGRVVSANQGKNLSDKLISKDIEIVYEFDLVDEIYNERPCMSKEKAFLIDIKYSGESFADKLSRIREKMKELKSTVHIITSLDDIAWLLNIRGRDVEYNPVVLSYLVITLDKIYLFIDENKLNKDVLNELNEVNINIKKYEEVYQFIKEIKSEESVLIDSFKINYLIYKNIPKDTNKIENSNPTTYMKCIKNEIELKNIRNSHIKDGVAVTKFMYWLKNNIGKIEITELSASEKLESLRREQVGFIEPSFNTIAGYKDHAAMMHYSATSESQYKLEQEGLFLVDSGGQYYDGTTDITRTIALGEISELLKQQFTAVVRGMICLSKAKFLYGTRGVNLDVLARGPLWECDMDYKCGTGHGIGFLLNVHEGPNSFYWKIGEDKIKNPILEEGMVTTNEPGIYVEGSHGIRIENEMVTKKGNKNEYGQFMYFEPITFAPIDLDAINPKYMNIDEIKYLNEYHEMVYNELSPYLNVDEKIWLKNYTRYID